jgi:hypothetical protein
MIRHVALAVLVFAVVTACAGIGLREPLRVGLAGVDSLPGEGLEVRFLARIRVQNPNDVSITYSGLSAEVDLNGRSFASGVSAATGEIPRFGESVIDLPITVPGTAIVRQVLGFIGSTPGKATYHIRGFLRALERGERAGEVPGVEQAAAEVHVADEVLGRECQSAPRAGHAPHGLTGPPQRFSEVRVIGRHARRQRHRSLERDDGSRRVALPEEHDRARVVSGRAIRRRVGHGPMVLDAGAPARPRRGCSANSVASRLPSRAGTKLTRW